jgi:hypothetical protein
MPGGISTAIISPPAIGSFVQFAEFRATRDKIGKMFHANY